METVADLLPALGLRIGAGPLELRGLGDDDLAALADLAARGVHEAGLMPFYVPWTEAPPEQGRGIGTAMRRAMCAFVLDHLDADEVTSGAFTDNPASLAVSRVGYRPNGRRRLRRREGELAVNQSLVLTREHLVRGEHPLVVDGLEAFRRSIGLPDTPHSPGTAGSTAPEAP